MRKVAIVTYEDIAFFELGCAIELFALPRPEVDDWYETDVVTLSSEPVTSTAQLVLSVKKVDSLCAYDTLVIPSWPTDGRTIPTELETALLLAVHNGTRVLAYCSGAFLLAQLGFLNSRKAVTHWRYEAEFRRRFPLVNYQTDVLYCFDSNIACSAGSAAAIDLSLEVIRQDFGYQVANTVARRMVLSAQRQGGQAQYAEKPIPITSSRFSKSLDWAKSVIDQPFSMLTFAEKAGMSRRSFDRKFRQDFNLSPQQWVIEQRINRAKSILETSERSIDQVAHICGFESAMSMRHHFRKRVGVSPKHFRNQFRHS